MIAGVNSAGVGVTWFYIDDEHSTRAATTGIKNIMNFVLKMIDFVLFVLQMIDFV